MVEFDTFGDKTYYGGQIHVAMKRGGGIHVAMKHITMVGSMLQ